MGKFTFKGLYILLFIAVMFSGKVFSQCPTVIQPAQNFCNTQSPTVANLVAVDNGGGIQWFSSATSTTPLLSTDVLVDGVTYYADDSTGTCGARQSVTVDIFYAPTGPNIQGFCIANSSDPLPTLADLVVTGNNIQWYNSSFGGTPLPITTTLTNGAIFYASQTPPGTSCETTRLGVSVTFLDVTDAPAGDSEQFFCEDSSNPPTVGDLVASGNNNWYASVDAVLPLSVTTPLVDGATYYSTLVVPPCESENRFPVTVRLYPENIAGDDGIRIICESDIPVLGTIDLFAELNGTPGVGGTWTGSLPVTGNSVDITGMQTGDVLVFTYTVSTSVNCPSDTATVTLSIPNDTNAGTPGSTTFCISDPGADLFAFIGGTPETGGVWTPALNSGTGFFDPSVDVAGVYTYTVTGAGGCSQSSTTVTVDVIDSAISGNFTGVQDVCNTTGTFDLFTLLDGTQETGGVWTNSGGAIVANIVNISAFAEGDYDFTYTVTNACFTASTTVTLHVSHALTPGVFTGMPELCTSLGTFDLFTLLDGTQDGGGTWTDQGGNPVSNIIDISSFTTDIYEFTYSLDNVCGVVSTTVSIHVFTPAVAGNFTGIMQNCDVTGFYDLFNLLDGTQDPGGVWTDALGAVVANPVNVSTFIAGTYNYTYSVTNICGTDSEMVSVTFDTTPDAGIGMSIQLCPADPSIDLFTVLGGTPDTGGTWAPALSSGTGVFNPAVDPAGDYTYTVTTSGGCLQRSATVNVTISPLTNSGVFIGLTDVCITSGPLDLFTLLDGSEDAGGTWTDSSNNPVSNLVSLGALSTGIQTYTYTITSTCGTSNTAVSFNLEDSTASGVFTGTQNVCTSVGTFDLFDLLDGSQDAGGTWVDSSNNTVTNPINISGFSAGIHDFAYIVTNSCGPMSTSVSLDIDTAPMSGVFTGVTENCTSVGFYDLFTSLDGSQDAGGVWLDSSNNPVSNPVDVSAFTAGTYSYSYSVTNACGTTVTTVDLFFPDTPDAGTNGSVSFCPSGLGADLFNSLGGTPATGGVWSPALNSGTGFFNPALDSAGTYTYTVTTSGGCLVNSATVTVNLLPLPSSGVFTGVQEICNSVGTFDLFGLLDGSQDTGGVWLDSSNNTVSNPIDVTGLVSGTYTYSYNVTNSCGTAATNVSFTIPATPDAGIDGSVTFCATGTGSDLFNSLGGTPATGGVWSPSLNSGTGFFNPAVDSSGTYTYTVTSSGGCTISSATVTVSVINNTLSSGVFTGVQDVCTTAGIFDLFSLLDGSQDAGGVWMDSSNATVSNTVNVGSLTAGTYSYTYNVTNACGTTSTSVTFNLDTTPEAGTFTGSQTVCNSVGAFDLFTLLDGSQTTGGVWTNSSSVTITNPVDVSALTAGTYTYTYTVTNACGTDTASVTLTIENSANSGVFTGVQDVCTTAGTFDLFSLLDGSQDAGGVWMDSSNATVSNTVNVGLLSAGAYTYTYNVTNACGTTSTSVTFNLDTTPEAGTFTGNQTVCNSVGVFDLFTLLDGSQTAGGVWANSSSVTITNPVDVSALTAGTYTYTYTVTNACGTDTASVTLTIENSANSGVFTGVQDVCTTVGTFDLFSLLDGSQTTGGIWMDSSNATVSNTINVGVLSAGTYTYTYNVTNACGTTSTSVTFNLDTTPEAGTFTGNQTVCNSVGVFDLFTLLDGSQTAGGVWINSSSVTITNPVDVSALTAGTYTYTYTVTNACGTDTVSVTLTIPSDPDAGTNGTVAFCNTDASADLFGFLGGTPDTNGVWSPALTSGTGVFNPSVDSAGVYTYTVSGCTQATATVTVTITTGTLNAGTFTGVQQVCDADTAFDLFTLLDGSQDMGGVWMDVSGNTISNPVNLTGFASGLTDFSYNVTNSCGTDSEVVQVMILDLDALTNFNAQIAAQICLDEDLTVTINNLPDGDYDLTYALSGSNTQAATVQAITVTGGTSSFTISGLTTLTNPGVTTLQILSLQYAGVNACEVAISDYELDVNIIDTPEITDAQISIDDICFGQDAVVVFSNLTLPDGNYSIDYTLQTTSGSDSATTTIIVSGGSASITIPASNIAADDTYSFNIDTITNTDLGCENTNANATVLFVVHPFPSINVALTKLNAQDVCLGSENMVNILNTSIPDNTYTITYQLSGAVNYTSGGINVTFVNGEAFFMIEEGILQNDGIVTVLLLTITDNAVVCPVDFSNIAQVDFMVTGGETPVLMAEGNKFCIQDYANPTLADLTNNLENPLDVVNWYSSATDDTPLSANTPITNGQVYYGAYQSYLDCPLIERLQVQIDIEFCDIIIPDGFSPNGDGVNETFEIKNLRYYYPEFSLEIFNRNGNVVYKGDFDTPDWDGTVNTGAFTFGDKGVPTGVYFFILKLNTDPQHNIQGRLYLNR